MLRVVLVDDERLARDGLRQLLAAHPGLAIVGEASRVSTAAEIIRAQRPDAIFLDIALPGADGFELLGQVEHPPKVVFFTAHAEHAARAFDVQAVDYLLKPVRPERLASAVRRLEAVCAQQPETAGYESRDRICLRTPERTLVAALSDLSALEAEGDFTRFHVRGQPALLIYRNLGAYEASLPRPPFFRVSRSLVINLDRVARLEQVSRDEARLVLRDHEGVFLLGRRALARLRRTLPNL